jgi:hypothetical protein
MNISTVTYQKLNHTWFIIRITYGLLFLILGLDKFARIMVTNWPDLISPVIHNIVHVPVDVILFLSASFELILTFLIFTHWPRLGGYLGALWLGAWTINYFHLESAWAMALSAAVMAIGSFTLGRLTTIKERITNEDLI